MSNSVTPALAQPHGAKPKADRQGQNKDIDQSAFGEALQASRKTGRGAPDEISIQSAPRWLAPVKLAVGIGAVERAAGEPMPEILASVEPGEIDEPDDKPRKSEDEAETNAAIAFLPIAVSAFHHPAFAVRRAGDKDDADPDLPKQQKVGIDLPVAVGKAEAATRTVVKQSVSVDRMAVPAPDKNAGAPETTPEISALRSATAGDKQPRAPEAAQPDAEIKPAAPRAIVVEQAAPALAQTGSTALNLAEKLATQAALIMAPAKPEIAPPTLAPAPVHAHTLKLQLHPAELGIVTASLRFAGEQLTIELQVESAHAHQRLSADSDAIVKTLRGLGYDIDRVTIMQPPIAPPAPSKADADPSLAGQSRSDSQSLDAGGSNNGGDRLARGNSGRGGEETPQDGQKNSGKREDRTGGGLYI